jgi:hypothetical protein
MNLTFARKPVAFHGRAPRVIARNAPQGTKLSNGGFAPIVQAKLRIGASEGSCRQPAADGSAASKASRTVHHKVQPGAVDCENDPPRRIETDAPADEIRNADTAATSILREAIAQLEVVRSGGADNRLLLFVYLRLRRYFGLFPEDLRPPVGEELRVRFGEYMTTAFLDSLLSRLRDRMQKMLESGNLKYECLARQHCGGKTHAWSLFGESAIHLCRRFWKSDADERPLTLIHELYHIVSEDADDEGVGLKNAHCIEGFVASLTKWPKLREGGCKR